MHNVNLKKCPSRILFLFPRYNNLYKNTFHNFKLPYQAVIINNYNLKTNSWNSLCLNYYLQKCI